MSQPEARAWWAEVEELRDTIERRRAAQGRVSPPPAPVAPLEARRTVRISGHGAAPPQPRPLAVARVRQPRAMHATAHRPDRIAGWAALLGLVLVLVSTVTH